MMQIKYDNNGRTLWQLYAKFRHSHMFVALIMHVTWSSDFFLWQMKMIATNFIWRSFFWFDIIQNSIAVRPKSGSFNWIIYLGHYIDFKFTKWLAHSQGSSMFVMSTISTWTASSLMNVRNLMNCLLFITIITPPGMVHFQKRHSTSPVAMFTFFMGQWLSLTTITRIHRYSLLFTMLMFE